MDSAPSKCGSRTTTHPGSRESREQAASRHGTEATGATAELRPESGEKLAADSNQSVKDARHGSTPDICAVNTGGKIWERGTSGGGKHICGVSTGRWKAHHRGEQPQCAYEECERTT